MPVSFDEKEEEMSMQLTPSTSATLLQSNEQLQQPHDSNENQTTEENSRSQRIRRRPAWMKDYEVSGVQSDNYDTIAYYAL